MLPPYVYAVAYLVITALLWAGNRNLGIKKPMMSATKWFVWTAAWFTFSAMMIGTPASATTLEVVGLNLAMAVFTYPMFLFGQAPGTSPLSIVLLWTGPWIAAAVGYVLAVRHNDHRRINPVKPKMTARDRWEARDRA
jgi:hypothetical protein